MKKVLSLVLTIALTLSIIPAGLFCITANAQMTEEFAGGSGTEADPYLIETKEQLNNVRFHLGAHYKMTTNIIFTADDFSEGGDFYNNGDGWQPIGDSSTPFTGCFDGNMHTVTGLKNEISLAFFSDKSTISLGLFGYIKNSTVKNLGMVDACITVGGSALSEDAPSVYAGSIAGYITNTTVINCYNTGNVIVTPSSSYKSVYAVVGGIVGYVDSGTIIDCYNAGNISITSVTTPSSDYYNVTGSAYGGGIAGSGEGKFINCFNQGDIAIKARSAGRSASQYYYERSYGFSYAYAGGIAGSGKSFTNCYNTAYINAESWAVPSSPSFSTKSYSHAGGIAGNGEDFVNCYNIEKIESNSVAYARNNTSGSPYNYAYAYSYAGGVAGKGNSFHNCYNIENVTAPASTSADYSDFTNRPECYKYSYAGGIAGYNNESISNCYTSTTPGVGENTGSGVVTICDKENMKNQATYIGFDFDHTWIMCVDVDHPYPKLKSSNMAGKMSLQSIEVTTKPSKLEFLEGETLNVSRGKLTLTYDGGATLVIDITADMVSGFKSNIIGKQALTVTYGDQATTYEIEVISKSPMSIELVRNGLKTNYIKGTALDVAGGIIRLHYNNGTYDDIPLMPDMVSGFDNTLIGVQQLTVTYEGFTTTYNVVVNENYLANVVFKTPPTKRVYVVGREEFDATGGKIELYYADGTVEEIDLTDDMVTGFSNDHVGWINLEASYMGYSIQFGVSIVPLEIISIEVIDNGIKKEYLESKDVLDVTGGDLRIYYNDSTYEEIELSVTMVSGFDNTVAGPQTLTVSYENHTDTYDIEIVARSLDRIAVTTLPDTTHYLVGKGVFSAAGGEITLYYDNDTTETVDLTNDMISGFSNKTVGTNTLTVSYGGKITTFNVTIDERSLTSIAITTKPTKTIYIEGEIFDTAGMVVEAYYDNDTSGIVTDYKVSGYDSAPGSKTIVVSYEGKTASFTVTVEEKRLAYISVTTKPNKMEYIEGEPFDPTGMVVTAHYYNCEDEIITEYSISGYDSTPSLDLITITYKGETTNFIVDVKSKSLTSISVTTKPSKTTYIESTALDDTGMVLTLYYNNNTSETITTGWVSEYDFSNVGTSVVEVTYGGKTCTYDVTVIAKTLTSIVVESEPNKLEYLEGDTSLDTDGLEIKAYYDNDTSEVINDNYTVTGYDSTPGTKTITVTYGGKIATFTVEVVAKSVTSIAVTKKPNKLTYLEGESFDKTGMVITAYYNNNTSGAVTDYTVSGYTSTIGTKTITVSYGGKSATFTVTVNSRVPSAITSSKYTVSGTNISKIGAGTTVANLLNGLGEGFYCKVYNGSSVVSGNTAVGTGMTVKIMDGNTAKATYTIIVTGDTNGDGNITVTDMIAIKAHVLKKSTLSGAYATAADTNGDNGISITDFIQVKAKILGKGTITAR